MDKTIGTSDYMAFRQEQSLKWKQRELLNENQEKIKVEQEIAQQRHEELIKNEKEYFMNKFFINLDKSIDEASKANDIVKINMITANFYFLLEENKVEIIEQGKQDAVLLKILGLIETINANQSTQFNVNRQGTFEVTSSQKIIDHMRNSLLLFGCDPNLLEIDVMDVSSDDKFAQDLYMDELISQQLSARNRNFYDYNEFF